MFLSSAEVEYRAMTDTCCELSWLWLLLLDLKILHLKPTLLYCDNLTILHIVANSVLHERTRHIAMECHFIRNKIQDDPVKTKYVFLVYQIANIFTKPSGNETFLTMICKFAVHYIRYST
jgi:hypothetical protein